MYWQSIILCYNIIKGDGVMAQTNLSIRVDEQDKKNFETFCNQTGMNISVAVNMFIKAVLREQKLPFEIKINESQIEGESDNG